MLVRLRSCVSDTLADCLHITHVIHGRGARVRCPDVRCPDSYDLFDYLLLHKDDEL